jgi:hypothetical protein
MEFGTNDNSWSCCWISTSNIDPFIPSKAMQCHEAKVENMANKVKK